MTLFAPHLIGLTVRLVFKQPVPGPSSQALNLKTVPFLGGKPLHIPAPDGTAYKSELTLFRDAEETVKLVFWYAPDPRPTPHTHPWPFASRILHGGYKEERYSLSGQYLESRVYRAGDVNICPMHAPHRVVEVLPGTVTLMECGQDSGAWHEVVNGDLVEPDSTAFREHFGKMNPFPR